MAFLADPGSADDLTQETYLRVLGALPRFAGRSSARTWLLSIARRVVVDQIQPQSGPPPHHRARSISKDLLSALADFRAVQGRRRSPDSARRGADSDRRDALVLDPGAGAVLRRGRRGVRCPLGTIRSRVARARDDLIAAARRDDLTG